MTVLHPYALLGLLLIPALLLLERWRRRPREQVWPSLLLWHAVAEAPAPSRRRRVEPLLLLECAAVALLSVAAAGPLLTGAAAPAVRVLLDDGPYMDARRADGTTARAATKREIDRVRARAEVTVQPVTGDLEAALAADPGALLATSRDVGGVRGFGYAAQGENLGIDAVHVTGDTLWFALATDGAPREVRVRVGEREISAPTGRGVEVPFAEGLEILDADNYDGDDAVALRRLAVVARNETGSNLVDAALFEAGLRARRDGEPDLVVTGDGGQPARGLVYGADCLVVGPLFDGLLLDDCAWRDPRVDGGDGVLLHSGRALATWDGRRLWLGMAVDREWDEHGTLAVLVERALRAAAARGLADGEVVVGDAVARPAPGQVDTRGVDRPWNGSLPPGAAAASEPVALRPWLAALAAAVLAVYLRALYGRD
jgi:hypothetical protein